MAQTLKSSGNTWKSLKNRATEGAGQRVQNIFAGSENGRNSEKTNNLGKKRSWFGVLIFVILFILAIPFLRPIVSDCFSSGFCQTNIVEPLKPVGEAFGEMFSFAGRGLSDTSKVLRGEQIFDWDGKVNENVRSGIWLEKGNNIAPRLTIAELNGDNVLQTALPSEFGTGIDIVIGKFDEKIEKINAKVTCSLKDRHSGRSVQGTFKKRPGLSVQSDNGVSTAILNFDNPGKIGENKQVFTSFSTGLVCVFSKSQGLEVIELEDRLIEGNVRKFFSTDVVFDLIYSLEPRVTLPIFIVENEDNFNDYLGRHKRDIFENLEGGSYSEYLVGDQIPSVMNFRTDVEAVMGFIPQPLTVGENFLFGVQFKNRNKYRTTFEKFTFEMPEGIEITTKNLIFSDVQENCENFISSNNDNVYELNVDKKIINEQLNSGNFVSQLYTCNVRVDESVKKGFELNYYGDVIGNLKYEMHVNESIGFSN